MSTYGKGGGKKFMQVLHPQIHGILRVEAKRRGVTVQELLRALVIPEWLEAYNAPFTPSQLRVYLLQKSVRDYKRGWKRGNTAQKHPKAGRPRR
jgi:hypothetical protein